MPAEHFEQQKNYKETPRKFENFSHDDFHIKLLDREFQNKKILIISFSSRKNSLALAG